MNVFEILDSFIVVQQTNTTLIQVEQNGEYSCQFCMFMPKSRKIWEILFLPCYSWYLPRSKINRK